MTPELFTKTVGEAARDARRRLRQVEYRTQSPDHPVLWGADQSLYLKFYIFQVVDDEKEQVLRIRAAASLFEGGAMRIANTVSDSIVDGPGLRFTVFTQGCPHRCPGCHNPGTHDPAGGREVSVAELATELSGNPLTNGLTSPAGELSARRAELRWPGPHARERGLNVLPIRYTYERLLAGEVPDALASLEQVDVLVDGPFVEAEKSYAALFRGSANQRLIDVPKSLAAGAVVLWERPDPLAHFTRPES